MGWNACCSKCNSDLDETLFHLRDDWPDDSTAETTSMLDWTVACPTCKYSTLLRELPAKAVMTPFYVHLGAGDLGDDAGAEILSDLEVFFGTPFNILWLHL